jgi:PDZ domain-containing secreted protein
MLNNSHFSGKFEFSDTIYNEKGKKIDVSFETLNKYFESLKSEGVWYDYDRYENNGKDVTIFHFEKDANSESK